MTVSHGAKTVKGMTENFCDQCDATLLAVFDMDRFWDFETGRIKCRECGAVNRPCNECFGTNIKDVVSCSNCPWNHAEAVESMTEIDYEQVSDSRYEVMPVPYQAL